MLFDLYAGLGGGFGGAIYVGTIDIEDYDKALSYAYELACEEYNSYGGMHGLVSYDDILDDPECYGFNEEEFLEYSEDVRDDLMDEIIREDMESWIDYDAIPTDENKDLDEERFMR